MKYLKIKNNTQKAFTLVETLVAISIFSMSLVAVMTLLGQGVGDTNYAKRKLTAEYLAQEGIEYIRNMRDTYIISASSTSSGWSQFSAKLADDDADCTSQHGCIFKPEGITSTITMPFYTCQAEWCTDYPIQYNSTTGSYGYAAGTNSGYSRIIKTSVVGGTNGNQIKVTSTVSWMQGLRRFNVSFSEVLFNWVE